MLRRPIQLIGAATVALGAVTLVAMPGASAAAPLSISPNSGPPGTRVAITVTNCNQPTVGFSDRTITATITGTSYVIPSNASDVGNFSVTCTPAGGGGATTSYTVPFSVTASTSSTTVTGHASTPTTAGHTTTTPSTSGSSSSTGSGSQVSRIPSGPAQTGGGSAAGGPSWSLAMGGGSMMLTGGTMAALAYRRRSGQALTR